MKKVTMADVAQYAGVSKSTVSQYLNRRYEYMGEQTKQRIEEAIEELGYQPNALARSLKQKKTSTIGVIVANILHSLTTQVIRAIEDRCFENDYHVIVCNTDDDPEKEKGYIMNLMAKQVDGLILFPTGGNADLYPSLIKQKFPLVFVDRMVEGIPIDAILLDNLNAADIAVETFVSHYHRHIAVISTSVDRPITPRVERLEGFKKALHKHGLPVVEEFIKGSDIQDIPTVLETMFSCPHPPTAILAGNDLVLMQILKFVKEKGLSIPDDLSIIGIDDIPFASLFSPTLTTIAQPAVEMGNKAVELLLEKIERNEGEDQPQIYRFCPQLIERESVCKVIQY